jgi:PKD repeat protein
MWKLVIGNCLALITVGAWADMPPTADFTTTLNPFNPQWVYVEAGPLSDPDGTIYTYEWSASDGQTISDPQNTLKFDDNGLYTIALKVIDKNGLTDIMRRTISVGGEAVTCSPHATYSVETNELEIPVVVYEPIRSIPVIGDSATVYNMVALQQGGNFRFTIKDDSLPLVEETATVNNPCHAIYAAVDKTLHIPFIDIVVSPDTTEVYQATLQYGEDDILKIKTLDQVE